MYEALQEDRVQMPSITSLKKILKKRGLSDSEINEAMKRGIDEAVRSDKENRVQHRNRKDDPAQHGLWGREDTDN